MVTTEADVSKRRRLRLLDTQVLRLQSRLDHLNEVADRYSWLRLAVVLLALVATGLIYYFFGTWPAALAAGLGGLAFSAAVYAHRRLDRAIACHRLWQQNKQAQIARATLDWDRIPGTASRPRANHPFEDDLDLAGPRSLHLLLDTAASYEGSQRLRAWLTAPVPELAQARRRQHLVRELAPMHLFRDRLLLNALTGGRERGTWSVAGSLARSPWRAGSLADWLGRGAEPVSSRGMTALAAQRRWLLLLGGLVVVNASLLIVSLLGLLPPLWQLTGVLYLGLWWVRARATAASWNEALSLRAALGRLRAVFRQLETFSYAGKPQLRALCAPFLNPRHRPSRYLAQLTRLVTAMSLRRNPVLGLLLNLVLPWDAYLAYRLGRTQAAMSGHAPGWMDAWFELEALSSLATFAYLNPDYAFPTLLGAGEANLPPGRDGPAVFVASGLGHPLIPDEQKVCNDLTVPHLGWVAIITGSNMAGKSVFLKTVGVNLSLAYAGGPVNARALQTVPFRLFASMEVSDSVTDGISYFYAEVKRLKALLSALEADEPLPLLFFIDEIFRGTNNRERLIGSRAYLRALVGQHGAGLIATHDLELASLRLPLAEGPAQQASAALVNYHFRDQVLQGRMVFDYVLRPGPCPTTNALKIMRLEGLPVPDVPADTTTH